MSDILSQVLEKISGKSTGQEESPAENTEKDKNVPEEISFSHSEQFDLLYPDEKKAEKKRVNDAPATLGGTAAT